MIDMGDDGDIANIGAAHLRGTGGKAGGSRAHEGRLFWQVERPVIVARSCDAEYGDVTAGAILAGGRNQFWNAAHNSIFSSKSREFWNAAVATDAKKLGRH